MKGVLIQARPLQLTRLHTAGLVPGWGSMGGRSAVLMPDVSVWGMCVHPGGSSTFADKRLKLKALTHDSLTRGNLPHVVGSGTALVLWKCARAVREPSSLSRFLLTISQSF